MAPINWRNVQAPNLGDPIDAMRLSGQLLDRGLSGLNTGISQFTAWQDDQNARRVGDAAIRIQDPVAFREALANGTLLGGMPGGTLSPAALEALQGRAGTLISQATGQQTLDTARTQDPIRTQNLIATGDQTRASTEGTRANTDQTRQTTGFNAELHPLNVRRAAAGATTAEVGASAATRTEGENVQTSSSRVDAAITGNVSTADQNRRAVQERAEQDEALRFFSEAQRAGFGAGDMRERLNNHSFSSERARELAIARLNQHLTSGSPLFPNPTVNEDGTPNQVTGSGVAPQAAPTGPGAAAPGGTAGAAIRAAVVAPTGNGLQFRPDGSVVTESIPFTETRNYVSRIGNAVRAANGGALPTGTPEQVADAVMPFLVGQESGGRHVDPRTGEPLTSNRGAQGVAQLMPGTAREYERRLGIEPGLSSQTTPEGRAANLRIGRQYFVDQLRAHNGNVELALASYNAGPGRVSGWLAGREATQVVEAARGTMTGAQDTQQGILAAAAARNSGPAGRYFETIAQSALPGADNTPGTVVNSLIGTAANPGPYFGRSRPDVTSMVTNITRRGITAPVAGQMLAQNLDTRISRMGSGPATNRIPNIFTGVPEVAPNETAIDREVTQFLAMDSAGSAREIRTAQNAATQLSNAIQTANRLEAQMKERATVARSDPEQHRNYERYRDAYRAAVQEVERLRARHAGLVQQAIQPPGGRPTTASASRPFGSTIPTD